jgi:hypothetical protein
MNHVVTCLSTQNSVKQGISTANLLYLLQGLKSQQPSAFSPRDGISLTRRVLNSEEQDAEINNNIYRRQNMMMHLFIFGLLYQVAYIDD